MGVGDEVSKSHETLVEAEMPLDDPDVAGCTVEELEWRERGISRALERVDNRLMQLMEERHYFENRLEEIRRELEEAEAI